MIRIAICDDDIHIAEELKEILVKSDKLENKSYKIDIFKGREDLFYEIEEKRSIDILFMDIELGETNGIDVVKEIKGICPYIKVIYITSHRKYVYEVFETEPIGFIRKPFNNKVVFKYLDIAVDKLDDSNYIYIKNDGGISKLKVNDIMYIYSEIRQVTFIDKRGNVYKTYGKLDEYEKEILKYKQLVRIHKSHIVNFDYVKRFEKKKVILFNHKELNISRERRAKVQEEIMKLMN